MASIENAVTLFHFFFSFPLSLLLKPRVSYGRKFGYNFSVFSAWPWLTGCSRKIPPEWPAYQEEPNSQTDDEDGSQPADGVTRLLKAPNRVVSFDCFLFLEWNVFRSFSRLLILFISLGKMSKAVFVKSHSLLRSGYGLQVICQLNVGIAISGIFQGLYKWKESPVLILWFLTHVVFAFCKALRDTSMFFSFFLAVLCSLWDLTSLTRDWTLALAVKALSLTQQGIPRNTHAFK